MSGSQPKLDGYQADRYNKTVLESEWTIHPGTFILPVAEAPPTDPEELKTWSPVAVVQAHAAFREKNLSYGAQKEGAPPVFPMPVDSPGLTFLGGSVGVPYPALNSAGGFSWTVGCEYRYVETGALNQETDGYVLGSPPWVYGQQVLNATQGNYSGQGAPSSVENAGVGPRVGYTLSLSLDPNQPGMLYSEPSYLPGTLQSRDIVTGPNSYSTL